MDMRLQEKEQEEKRDCSSTLEHSDVSGLVSEAGPDTILTATERLDSWCEWLAKHGGKICIRVTTTYPGLGKDELVQNPDGVHMGFEILDPNGVLVFKSPESKVRPIP